MRCSAGGDSSPRFCSREMAVIMRIVCKLAALPRGMPNSLHADCGTDYRGRG